MTSLKNEKIVLSKETVTRLLSDVKDLIKNPLTDENIVYIHDDLDMLKGYALILGPPDCLYWGGAYLFEFNFPTNYPYSPPKVVYCTNDGITRFNPNLYRNGKVCVSILNTWKGEQWTSCQTIRSVLMTLVTLFHSDPIINEPGFQKNDKEAASYNKILEYKNYEVAIVGMLTKKYLPNQFALFHCFIKEYFMKNAEAYKEKLEKKMADTKREKVAIRLYTMCAEIDYKKLYNYFMESCYNPLIIDKVDNIYEESVFNASE